MACKHILMCRGEQHAHLEDDCKEDGVSSSQFFINSLLSGFDFFNARLILERLALNSIDSVVIYGKRITVMPQLDS